MEPTLAWKYSSAGAHRNEVQITKITRSLSGGTSAAISNSVVLDNNLVGAGTPGSPYRTSLLNGIGVTKTNLNKDLMHKLRSMTETIKMLSKENEALLTKNSQLRQYKTMNEANSASLDEKVKALKEEISNLHRAQNQLQERSGVNMETETETQTMKSTGDKDKYKALARRLKEERNHFRETCEEKQREQCALKVEMEKMSVIISELRDECQKLEQELLYARQASRESNSVGVQVSLQSKVISQPPSRRTSTTSSIITQEAVKRAQSVYGSKTKLKQRVPISVRNGQLQNSSSSSSVVSLKDVEEVSLRLRPLISTRSAATSPSKPSPLSVKSSPQPQRSTPGPTIARPVARVGQTPAKSTQQQSPVVKSNVNTPSPIRAASANRIPVSSTISSCSFSTPSRVLSPSRIPSPKARANRIPSAPKYKPPVRSIEPQPQTKPKVFTPPPPPPSTVAQEEETSASSSSAISRNSTFSRETAVSKFVHSLDHTPKFMTPPPAPPQSRADTIESKKSLDETRTLLSNDEDGDDEILCVHSDGQMEILPSSQMSNRTIGHNMVSPLPKSSFENLVVPTLTSTPSRSRADEQAKIESHSADDEGSRDGENPSSSSRQNFSSPFSTFTPKTKKRVESFKQGLAARRIQRTWKHFYQELEDRRALCANELQEHFKPHPELEQVFQDDAAEIVRSPSIRSSSSESKITEPSRYSHPKSTSPTIKSDERSVSASSRGSLTLNQVSAILEASDLRMKTLSRLKSIVHIPKKDVKPLPIDNLQRTEVKSQEITDKDMSSIQSVFEGHNLRRLIYRNLRTEYGRFSD